MVIYLQEPTETDAFRKIEAETGAKQGKGTKYQHMVSMKQCLESMNVADITKTDPTSGPKLFAFTNDQNIQMMVVGIEGFVINVEGTSFA